MEPMIGMKGLKIIHEKWQSLKILVPKVLKTFSDIEDLERFTKDHHGSTKDCSWSHHGGEVNPKVICCLNKSFLSTLRPTFAIGLTGFWTSGSDSRNG